VQQLCLTCAVRDKCSDLGIGMTLGLACGGLLDIDVYWRSAACVARDGNMATRSGFPASYPIELLLVMVGAITLVLHS